MCAIISDQKEKKLKAQMSVAGNQVKPQSHTEICASSKTQ